MKKVLTILSVLLISSSVWAGGNADVVIKWGGPSGQGKMIFWEPATGNTNMVIETNGNVTFYGTLTAGSIVTQNVTSLGDVTESSAVNYGAEKVSGATTLGSTLTVTGVVNMASTVKIAGSVTFGSSATVTGTVTCGAIVSTGTESVCSITVTGAAGVASTTVTGTGLGTFGGILSTGVESVCSITVTGGAVTQASAPVFNAALGTPSILGTLWTNCPAGSKTNWAIWIPAAVGNTNVWIPCFQQ